MQDRKGADYKNYLAMLLDYLYSFLKRVKPLLDLDNQLDEVTKDFSQKFDKGEFPGWPRETGSALTHTGAHLDLSAFYGAEELAITLDGKDNRGGGEQRALPVS